MGDETEHGERGKQGSDMALTIWTIVETSNCFPSVKPQSFGFLMSPYMGSEVCVLPVLSWAKYLCRVRQRPRKSAQLAGSAGRFGQFIKLQGHGCCEFAGGLQSASHRTHHHRASESHAVISASSMTLSFFTSLMCLWRVGWGGRVGEEAAT